jgi:NTE family protein
MSEVDRVAIACQGGGSHTAFTAGVLRELVPWVDAHEGYELGGLSGTSGGAFAAVTAWYGYLTLDENASALLSSLWDDLAATTPTDRVTNDTVLWGTIVETMGMPVPEVTPYNVPFDGWTRNRLRRSLESHVDFERLSALATEDAPRLVVGAVDITTGKFATFIDGDVSADAVLASAAVPELFEAIEIDGNRYWDGLFSQNPPIRELFHVPPERKPDELWVVQINPQAREHVPRSLREIADRRNELAGNISLNQELRFVDRMNDLLERGHLPTEEYKHTSVRRIQLERDLGYASKLNRSPGFVDDLVAHGSEQATAFLDEREQ